MAGYPTKNPEPPLVLREAADWFERVHAESVSEDELASWQHWLTASAAHRRAFAEVERFWNASGGIAEPPWPTYGELQADEYDGTVPVARWRETKDGERAAAQPHGPRSWWRPRRGSIWIVAASVIGAATALVAVLIALRLLVSPTYPAVYETPARSHREVTLEDGTRVLLGAKTVLYVHYTASTRNVLLPVGEAFFTVRADRSRPFVVRAGGRAITALATEFDVESQPGRVVVTVVRGEVIITGLEELNLDSTPGREASVGTARPEVIGTQLAPHRLSAGQRLVYMEEAQPELQRVDPEHALGWRQGRLTFLNEPLKYVIQDVARYTSRQLVIRDRSVEELRYTGSLMREDVDEWLRSLEEVFPLKVSRISGDRVILSDSRIPPPDGAPLPD